MNKYGASSIIFAVFLFFNVVVSFNVKACKDIVACGDATDGDYNLLLKVRDPSRPGLQVLCIVPEGYEYVYHHPWTGRLMNFKTLHKYIGVATENDVIPNVVKAGMTLTDSGLAFGDADTVSGWINPTKYRWDDFDWIRYSCEKADTEDEAIALLTKDVVSRLHATGVSENLFVVGPNKGYIVEADAFHYTVKEIEDGVAVMSNYPKELWRTQVLKKLPISWSFDTVVEKTVRKHGVVRLNSLYGIKIVDIKEDCIYVKPVSLVHMLRTNNIGVIYKIPLGERETVGYFSVELLEVNGKQAKVQVTNVFKAWEEKMLEHIQPCYGRITVKDMMNWSRLNREDLDGLRPMCEELFKYEAAAIYRIPRDNYKTLSCGWFSPNHACSSIYVPFHICDKDIFESYRNGEAAQLSLDLLNIYGVENLSTSFSKTEDVFLNEIKSIEEISKNLLKKRIDVSDLLTIIDIEMQRQAFLTEEIWIEASQVSDSLIRDTINNLWEENYTVSLNKMKTAISIFNGIHGSTFLKEKIIEIATSIARSRVDAAEAIGKQTSSIREEYQKGEQLLQQGEYEQGFDYLQKAFIESDMLIRGVIPQNIGTVEPEETNTSLSITLLYIVVLLSITTIFIIVLKRKLS
ncbi:MAG: hypothetical protein DRM99_03835 [Thermoplasmata archaeon]|nr:MAG: hypothetical protein DRM99_03835 [Thermoplasmata archaeon]